MDKEITCKDCQTVFILTSGEQEFYASKVGDDGQQMKEPKRCTDCRVKKRARNDRGQGPKI